MANKQFILSRLKVFLLHSLIFFYFFSFSSPLFSQEKVLAPSAPSMLSQKEGAVAQQFTGVSFETQVNQPPSIAPLGAQRIDEGDLLTFTLEAQDPDGLAADFNHNGTVDLIDLAFLRN